MVTDAPDVSYKGMTKFEKERMKQADEIERPIEEKEQEVQERNAKSGFLSKLSPHTKPRAYVAFGLLTSIVQGSIFPIFAIFIMKEIFILGNEDFYTPSDWDNKAREQIIYMAIAAFVSLLSAFAQKSSFGLVGENITLAMRSSLYKAYLTKHMGWFDNRDNAPGILTSALANDTSILNGASTEGIAVIFEATFAILVGIIIGFSYNWKIALVALCCTPFFAVGAAINAKF